MPKKTQSRNRRRKPMRKKRTMKRKRVSFKKKSLMGFPYNPKKKTYYESVTEGTSTITPSPGLSIARLTTLSIGGTLIDGRLNSQVYCKGFRVRAFFKNNLFRPMVVHMALVNPRNNQFNVGDFSLGFFRAMGLGSLAGQLDDLNFGATALQGIHYATMPINTEVYNVVWHLRFKLGVITTTGGYSSGELKNYRTVSRYIPINKVINYPDSTSGNPEANQQFYMLMWGAPIDYKSVDGPVDNALEHSLHTVMAFDRMG